MNRQALLHRIGDLAARAAARPRQGIDALVMHSTTEDGEEYVSEWVCRCDRPTIAGGITIEGAGPCPECGRRPGDEPDEPAE